MTACDFFGIQEHKQLHRDFVDHIRSLSHKFDEDPEGSAEIVNKRLLSFLQDWLNHHILIEDKAYCAAVEANPAARQAAKSFKAIEIWWSH
jgi:hemerythrin-like metal-binding protein